METAIALLNGIDAQSCCDIPLKIKAELRYENVATQGFETFFQDKKIPPDFLDYQMEVCFLY